MDRTELKARLKQQGMSLRDFAKRVDMNEDTIYHWVDVPAWVGWLLDELERPRWNGKT